MNDIFSNSVSTLDTELLALAAMRDRVSQSVAEAVELILTMRGRVVLVGMEKSEISGQKIAATLGIKGKLVITITHQRFQLLAHLSQKMHWSLPCQLREISILTTLHVFILAVVWVESC